jgi:hypothetical protein
LFGRHASGFGLLGLLQVLAAVSLLKEVYFEKGSVVYLSGRRTA